MGLDTCHDFSGHGSDGDAGPGGTCRVGSRRDRGRRIRHVRRCAHRAAPIECRTSPLTRHSIEVKDISLTDYINVNHAVYVPHTAGRYAKKQFAKGRMPIVERLVNA
jgi:hypothetical protein